MAFTVAKKIVQFRQLAKKFLEYYDDGDGNPAVRRHVKRTQKLLDENGNDEKTLRNWKRLGEAIIKNEDVLGGGCDVRRFAAMQLCFLLGKEYRLTLSSRIKIEGVVIPPRDFNFDAVLETRSFLSFLFDGCTVTIKDKSGGIVAENVPLTGITSY